MLPTAGTFRFQGTAPKAMARSGVPLTLPASRRSTVGSGLFGAYVIQPLKGDASPLRGWMT